MPWQKGVPKPRDVVARSVATQAAQRRLIELHRQEAHRNALLYRQTFRERVSEGLKKYRARIAK